MDRTPLIPLPIRQTEAAFQVTIRPPAFQLGHRWAEFQAAVFSRLSPFGLRIGDIKVENPTGNPGDFSVACWILGYSVAVRYRFDRIEVWTSSLPLLTDLERAADVLSAAIRVAQDLDVGSSIAGQSVSINLHVEAPAEFVESTLAKLTARPPHGAPELVPSGVAFASKLSDGTVAIVLERSKQIAEGLFLRVSADYSHSVGELDALTRTSTFIADFAGRIGVDLLWEAR